MAGDDRHSAGLFEELHGLISARLSEQITAQQMARLEALVIRDRRARRLYLSYMQDTALLRRMARASETNRRDAASRELDALQESLLAQRLNASGEAGRAVKIDPTTGEAITPPGTWGGGADDDVGGPGAPGRSFSPRSAAAAAAIAASLIGLLVFLLIPSGPDGPAAPVAVLLETHHAQWQDEHGRLIFVKDGRHLPPGRYSLADGLAKLKFNGGALAVLDARQRPAIIELIDDRRAMLQQGRMTLHIRHDGARGFAVDLPCRRRIVDLGTEFGVIVDEHGVSDVYVMEGKVDAQLVDRDGGVVGHLEVEKSHNVRLLETGQSVEHEAIRLGEFVSEEHFDQKRQEAKSRTAAAPTVRGYATVRSYRYAAVHAQNQPHYNYQDTGERELTDGHIGRNEYLDPRWVGWLDGQDKPNVFTPDSGRPQPRIEFDLGEQTTVTGVEMVFLIHPRGSVYAPDRIDVTLSGDSDFDTISHLAIGEGFATDDGPDRAITARIGMPPTSARYVRIDCFNDRQWTFISEVRFVTETKAPPRQ